MQRLLPMLSLIIAVGCPQSEPTDKTPGTDPTNPDPITDTGTPTTDTGTPTTDTGTPTTDTGTPTTTTSPPIVDSCPTGSSLFADLDYVAARDAFEACVQADPSDGGAQLGLAMSELLLLPDWAPFVDALGRCGEATDLTSQLYGVGGELDALGQAFEGTISVTVDHVTDAGATALSVLAQPKVSYSSISEYWIDVWPAPQQRRELVVDVADSFSYANNLWIRLDLDDVYEDGSDVALAAGQVLDVADLSPYAVNLYLGCGQPGSSCGGWYRSSYQPEGTLTVVAFGEDEGDLIELDLDLREPTWCSGGSCSGRWDVQGTVSDTLSVDYYETPAWVPFSSVQSTICDVEDCDWRTEAYTVVEDLCTVEDHLVINNLALDIASELDAVGDAFAQAAALGARHELRLDNLFFVQGVVPMGAGEAELIAGALHAGAASARLAASYDIMDPAGDPSSLSAPYIGSQYQFDSSSGSFVCMDTPMYGLSVATAAQQLEAHLLDHSSVADFAGAQAGLELALTELRDALLAAPSETELYDMSPAPSWRDDVADDLDVMITSLQGTDGSLASAPSWDVTLGAFFAAPTSKSSLLAATGVPGLLRLDDASCEDEIEMAQAPLEWLVENGGGAMVLPQSVLNGNGPYPALINGNRIENELLDPQTYEPLIFEDVLLDLFE